MKPAFDREQTRAIPVLAPQDPDQRPDPVLCEGGCGRTVDWVWYTRLPLPRWVLESQPCGTCKYAADLDANAKERAKRKKRAKLPPKHAGWTLRDRQGLRVQGDEDAGSFMREVLTLGKPHLGVLRVNGSVLHALRRWRGGHSVYLYGPVGRSKTTLAAAMASDIAIGEDCGWRLRTDEELQAKYGDEVPPSRMRERVRVMVEQLDIAMIDESELMARQRLSWKGDPVPLYRYSRAPLLVLDDLGKSTKLPVVEAMERLISYRYDHELATVFTSNIAWDDLPESPYSDRIVSRLREMVPHHARLELHGPSWRDPPEPASPHPRRGPAGQAFRAAERTRRTR